MVRQAREIEYNERDPRVPRDPRSINARIRMLSGARALGFSIFEVLSLRRLRNKIGRGDYEDDR